MKLTKIVIASTLSTFAFISTAALAETFNFGEGQSSMSGNGGASHHTPPPKHKKPKKTQRAADQGARSQP
jgi:hypothetical protein